LSSLKKFFVHGGFLSIKRCSGHGETENQAVRSFKTVQCTEICKLHSLFLRRRMQYNENSASPLPTFADFACTNMELRRRRLSSHTSPLEPSVVVVPTAASTLGEGDDGPHGVVRLRRGGTPILGLAQDTPSGAPGGSKRHPSRG